MSLLLSPSSAITRRIQQRETVLQDLEDAQERLGEIKSGFDSLQPPPRFMKIHDLALGAVTEADTAVELLETGLRSASFAEIDKSKEHMAEAIRLLDAIPDAVASEFGDCASQGD